MGVEALFTNKGFDSISRSHYAKPSKPLYLCISWPFSWDDGERYRNNHLFPSSSSWFVELANADTTNLWNSFYL